MKLGRVIVVCLSFLSFFLSFFSSVIGSIGLSFELRRDVMWCDAMRWNEIRRGTTKYDTTQRISRRQVFSESFFAGHGERKDSAGLALLHLEKEPGGEGRRTAVALLSLSSLAVLN